MPNNDNRHHDTSLTIQILASSQKHQLEDKNNERITKSHYLLPEARKNMLAFSRTKPQLLHREEEAKENKSWPSIKNEILVSSQK